MASVVGLYSNLAQLLGGAIPRVDDRAVIPYKIGRDGPRYAMGADGRVIRDDLALTGAAKVLADGGTSIESPIFGSGDAGPANVSAAAGYGFQQAKTIDGDGLYFSGQDLSDYDFHEAVFTRADFSGARLVGTNLRRADMRESDLEGADLSFADLRRADLRLADFTGANLTSTDLRGADLSGAKGLTELQLHRAIIDDGTTLPSFDGATVMANEPGYYSYSNGWDYSGQDLAFADFSHADARNAVFAAASLVRADFSYTLVAGADFSGADLTGADLRLALGLTADQLAGAVLDETTKLPTHLSYLNVARD